MMLNTVAQNFFFLLRSSSRICALPLACVVETMRPLPIRPFLGSPAFVPGMSVIRGTPIVVVDLGVLLGRQEPTIVSRFVTLRVGERRLALAVESVLGIKQVPESSLQALPSLLRDSDLQLVDRVGVLDSDLLVVLQASRMLPDEIWHAMMAEEGNT